MSATSLVPLICYTHPNGQTSNLKNANILCGSEEHTPMLIGGCLLLAFGTLYVNNSSSLMSCPIIPPRMSVFHSQKCFFS